MRHLVPSSLPAPTSAYFTSFWILVQILLLTGLFLVSLIAFMSSCAIREHCVPLGLQITVATVRCICFCGYLHPTLNEGKDLICIYFLYIMRVPYLIPVLPGTQSAVSMYFLNK